MRAPRTPFELSKFRRCEPRGSTTVIINGILSEFSRLSLPAQNGQNSRLHHCETQSFLHIHDANAQQERHVQERHCFEKMPSIRNLLRAGGKVTELCDSRQRHPRLMSSGGNFRKSSTGHMQIPRQPKMRIEPSDVPELRQCCYRKRKSQADTSENCSCEHGELNEMAERELAYEQLCLIPLRTHVPAQASRCTRKEVERTRLHRPTRTQGKATQDPWVQWNRHEVCPSTSSSATVQSRCSSDAKTFAFCGVT